MLDLQSVKWCVSVFVSGVAHGVALLAQQCVSVCGRQAAGASAHVCMQRGSAPSQGHLLFLHRFPAQTHIHIRRHTLPHNHTHTHTRTKHARRASRHDIYDEIVVGFECQKLRTCTARAVAVLQCMSRFLNIKLSQQAPVTAPSYLERAATLLFVACLFPHGTVLQSLCDRLLRRSILLDTNALPR